MVHVILAILVCRESSAWLDTTVDLAKDPQAGGVLKVACAFLYAAADTDAENVRLRTLPGLLVAFDQLRATDEELSFVAVTFLPQRDDDFFGVGLLRTRGFVINDECARLWPFEFSFGASTFCKFVVWSLVEYELVLYLDADVEVKQPLFAEMFLRPTSLIVQLALHGGAPVVLGKCRGDFKTNIAFLNGGLILLRPDAHVSARLLGLASDVRLAANASSPENFRWVRVHGLPSPIYTIHEQSLLANFFIRRPQGMWLIPADFVHSPRVRLHPSPQAHLYQNGSVNVTRTSHLPSAWAAKPLPFIHYAGKCKPHVTCLQDPSRRQCKKAFCMDWAAHVHRIAAGDADFRRTLNSSGTVK